MKERIALSALLGVCAITLSVTLLSSPTDESGAFFAAILFIVALGAAVAFLAFSAGDRAGLTKKDGPASDQQA